MLHNLFRNFPLSFVSTSLRLLLSKTDQLLSFSATNFTVAKYGKLPSYGFDDSFESPWYPDMESGLSGLGADILL